jgi:hypothetical protein
VPTLLCRRNVDRRAVIGAYLGGTPSRRKLYNR